MGLADYSRGVPNKDAGRRRRVRDVAYDMHRTEDALHEIADRTADPQGTHAKADAISAEADRLLDSID